MKKTYLIFCFKYQTSDRGHYSPKEKTGFKGSKKEIEGMAKNMDSEPILHPKKPGNNHSSKFLGKNIGATLFDLLHKLMNSIC